MLKRILAVGGCGYVGSKLVKALKEKGYEVAVYDKIQDILDKEELESYIKEVKIVYHLAALAKLAYTDAHPEETYKVNIEGTNNVCELCAKHDVLLNFVSTCCLYGEPLEMPSREDGLINPTDTYAMSKAAGEYLVKMWHLSKGLRYNILRLGTVYGPSKKKEMRNDMAIQIFLEKTLKGEPIPIDGDGKQIRNFIHIDDAVKGFIAITEKGIEGETINIAGKEQISIEDIVLMAGELGKSKEVVYRPIRKDDFRYQNIYLGKAKKLLGWQPEIRFADGIKEFYEWLK